jgi:hypothetical protein
MNGWFHRHVVVAVVVARGLEITGVKVDAKHMPWLASHCDPPLPHYVPILSTHQLGCTQQWGSVPSSTTTGHTINRVFLHIGG